MTHDNRTIPACDVSRKAADALLIGIIGLAPLVMGGRHPLGTLVYVALVALLALTWVAGQVFAEAGSWRHSRVEWLLIAAVLLISAQLVPLPSSWVSGLSPQLARDLPLWAGEDPSPAHLGDWNRLTFYPAATRQGLAVLIAHAMLFLIMIQRLWTLHDVERVLRWVAIAAVGMGTLGLAQYLAGNGKFLWIYEHPTRDTSTAVKGTFANQNHFAHFLALGIGPLIWWLVGAARSVDHLGDRASFAAPRPDARHHATLIALSFGLGIVVFAGLLSYSRGGVLIMLVAAATCVAIYVASSLLSKRSLLVFAGGAGIVGVALSVHGYQLLRAELDTLTAASLESLDQHRGRRNIWAADWQAITRYPMTGTGIGTHRYVYPTYYREPSDVEYTHAECGYLEVLLEAGVPGLTLLLLGIGACAGWCIVGLRHASSPRIIASVGAVTAGLAASAAHAAFDFVWHIPACMSVTVIYAACACRLCQLERKRLFGVSSSRPVSRWLWSSFGGVTALVAIGMVHTWLGPGLAARHWESYLALSLDSRCPDVSSLVSRAETAAYRGFVERTAAMRRHLQHVLRHHGDDARAHLRLAAMCLRLFDHYQHHSDNAMSLAQIRDAALASQFPSRTALYQWLKVAVGENRTYLDQALAHTRRALQLCPLQGEGYLYLAELAFLEGRGREAHSQYVGQALRLRPYDGAVLFAAGRETALTGQITLALEFWRRAFHQDPEQQRAIIALLAPRMPPSFLITQFRPDRQGMLALYEHYRAQSLDDQAKEVGRRLAVMLEQAAKHQSDLQAARMWQQAQQVHAFLGNRERALDCVRQALAQAPSHYRLRYELAVSLYEQQQYQDCIPHLTWCTRRRPHDSRLKRMLRNARQRSVAPAVAGPPRPQPMHR